MPGVKFGELNAWIPSWNFHVGVRNLKNIDVRVRNLISCYISVYCSLTLLVSQNWHPRLVSKLIFDFSRE